MLECAGQWSPAFQQLLVQQGTTQAHLVQQADLQHKQMVDLSSRLDDIARTIHAIHLAMNPTSAMDAE